MQVQVAVSLNIFSHLTYNYDGESQTLPIGSRVLVPVGNRITHGWVTATQTDYKGKIKPLTGIVRDGYIPDPVFMNFVSQVSTLYLTSTGLLLDYSLPPSRKSTTNLYFSNQEKLLKLKDFSLSQLQKLGGRKPIEFFYKSHPPEDLLHATISTPSTFDAPSPLHTFLIDYSRIDYYREIINKTIKQGRSVLFVVPDNLTASYWGDIFPDAQMYNSGLTPKKRDSIWEEYTWEGKTGLIIGGLSAVMLPLPNLGAIICDRTASNLYKRNYFTPYHIDEIARIRAQYFKVPLIEGDACHSVRAYMNNQSIEIVDNRAVEVAPSVEVHNIPPRTRGIPDMFIQIVRDSYKEKKKILVVSNKKESTNFLFCPQCSLIIRCPVCGGFPIVDEQYGFTCSHCNKTFSEYKQCSKCSGELTIIESLSVSSIAKTIKHSIAETGVMSLSSEGLTREYLQPVLKRIEEHDIIVSTPITANPYFKNIFDTILYIRPESLFNLDKYDAAENIFTLVSNFKEIIKPSGNIHLFSTFHFHYSLKLVNDEPAFFERELKYRQWFSLPPFNSIYKIEIKAKTIRELAALLRGIYKANKKSLNIKRVYLTQRHPVKGIYRGIIEAHASASAIIESRLTHERNTTVTLEYV